MNLNYFVVPDNETNTTNLTWSLHGSSADAYFGRFKNINGEPMCPPSNVLPNRTKCVDGQLFGTGVSLNNADKIQLNNSLDGMTLTLFDMKRNEKKYNLVKSCDQTHKTFFKTCAAHIEKTNLEDDTTGLDPNTISQTEEESLTSRRLRTIEKLKNIANQKIEYHHSIHKPVYKSMFYNVKHDVKEFRDYMKKKYTRLN